MDNNESRRGFLKAAGAAILLYATGCGRRTATQGTNASEPDAGVEDSFIGKDYQKEDSQPADTTSPGRDSSCNGTISFTNQQGISYLIGNVTLAGNGVATKSDDDFIHYIEGASWDTMQIKKSDYVVLSHPISGDGGVTRIVRFNAVDTVNSLVQFTEVGTGADINSQFNPADGSGILAIGGYTFGYRLLSGRLSFDLNDDEKCDGSEVPIFTKQGKKTLAELLGCK